MGHRLLAVAMQGEDPTLYESADHGVNVDKSVESVRFQSDNKSAVVRGMTMSDERQDDLLPGLKITEDVLLQVQMWIYNLVVGQWKNLLSVLVVLLVVLIHGLYTDSVPKHREKYMLRSQW